MTQRRDGEPGRGENTRSPTLSLLTDPAHWTQKLLFAGVSQNPTSCLNERSVSLRKPAKL